jgi:hypothetical protein
MHGYDTLRGAWNETGRRWEDVPWQSAQHDAVTDARKFILNVPGVQFTRVVKAGQIGTTFQCSLPKLLYGKNSRTLPVDDHEDALGKLDAVIQQWFPGAPPAAEMTPRRIDATDDRHLADEMMVSKALASLHMVQLRGKSPWVGQEGTVCWPSKRGAHQTKAYSKCVESGDAEAAGILRIEREAKGLKCIRADVAKALALAMENGHLTIGEALAVPTLPQAILGPFTAIVDAIVEEAKNVDNVEAFTRLVKAGCTMTRAGTILGWVSVVQRVGWDSLNVSRNAKYEARQLLDRAGLDVAEIQFSPFQKQVLKTGPATDRAIKKVRREDEQENVTFANDAKAAA